MSIQPADNSYRTIAKIGALVCFLGAFGLAILGILLGIATYAAAPADPLLGKMTPGQLAVAGCGPFVIAAVLLALLGVGLLRLFGRDRLPEKAAAKSIVGCLSLTGIGCFSWIALSAFITLASGTMLATGEKAGLGEVLVVVSGTAIVLVLLAITGGFVWRHFVKLSEGEVLQHVARYCEEMRAWQARFHGAQAQAAAEARQVVRRETARLLARIPPASKAQVATVLYELNYLTPQGMNVDGLDFRQVDLCGANFPGVCLAGADLSGANFQGAELRWANLCRAHCQAVNFRGANLSGANFWRSRFDSADLSGADLTSANFTDTVIAPHQIHAAQKRDGVILPDGARG